MPQLVFNAISLKESRPALQILSFAASLFLPQGCTQALSLSVPLFFSIAENVMMATLTCWIWMRRLIGLILCPPSPPCSPFFTSTCCTKKSEVILSSTAWWFKLSRELLPWSGSCSFSSPAATSWSSAAGWVGPQKPQEGADVVDQVICNVVDNDWINLERRCDYFDASGSVGRQRKQGGADVDDHMWW